jgi:hypothetical protein
LAVRTPFSTLSAKPPHLPFPRYPLIAKDLEHLTDLLKRLPSQAPAVLALVKAFLKANMFTGTLCFAMRN